jgi:DnaJ-class molecular chaperone
MYDDVVLCLSRMETFTDVYAYPHVQILMDPEKRKMYDEYGEDALRDGGASGGMHDPFDIFNSFFGGGGGGGGGS